MRSRALGLVAITLTSALGFSGIVGTAQTQTQPPARSTDHSQTQSVAHTMG